MFNQCNQKKKQQFEWFLIIYLSAVSSAWPLNGVNKTTPRPAPPRLASWHRIVWVTSPAIVLIPISPQCTPKKQTSVDWRWQLCLSGSAHTKNIQLSTFEALEPFFHFSAELGSNHNVNVKRLWYISIGYIIWSSPFMLINLEQCREG